MSRLHRARRTLRTRLLDQVENPPNAEQSAEAEPTPAVSLAAFRNRRGG
jgi:hypothetical protein